eukprot:3970660-Amphidinium_carterae.1
MHKFHVQVPACNSHGLQSCWQPVLYLLKQTQTQTETQRRRDTETQAHRHTDTQTHSPMRSRMSFPLTQPHSIYAHGRHGNACKMRATVLADVRFV